MDHITVSPMSLNDLVVRFCVMSEQGPSIEYATRRTQHRPQRFATMALIVGAVSLFVPLLGIVAILLGHKAREGAQRQGFSPARRSRVAISLGLVSFVLHLAVAGFVARYFVVESRKVYCRMNLEMIMQGFLLYSNENRGKYPPDFTALNKVQDLTPGVFVCPARSTDLPTSFFTNEIDARKAGTLDYVFIHGALTPTTFESRFAGVSDYPVVIERLSNHGNGAHVLWSASGVQFTPTPAFDALIKRLRDQSLITDEEYQFLIAK